MFKSKKQEVKKIVATLKKPGKPVKKAAPVKTKAKAKVNAKNKGKPNISKALKELEKHLKEKTKENPILKRIAEAKAESENYAHLCLVYVRHDGKVGYKLHTDDLTVLMGALEVSKLSLATDIIWNENE